MKIRPWRFEPAQIVINLSLIHIWVHSAMMRSRLVAAQTKSFLIMRMIKNDFVWAATNRDRIIAEWTQMCIRDRLITICAGSNRQGRIFTKLHRSSRAGGMGLGYNSRLT